MMRPLSVDPFPEIDAALLNSADIQAYQAACELIRGVPFKKKDLKAASYKILCQGTIFWTDDNRLRKSTRISGEQVFTLKPNSIAFVSPDAEFFLPDYMAARFNLSISLVHQGLLLGTGPLIDPGFEGKLSIPIHNLTTREVELKASSGLISVEFTKLSPRCERTHGHNRYEFIRSFKEGQLGGPLERYFDNTGGVPTQSTLHDNAKTWAQEIKNVRELQDLAQAQEQRWKTWGFVGAVISLIGLAALVVSVYQSYQMSVSVAQSAQASAEAARQSIVDAKKAASDENERLAARIDQLSKDLEALKTAKAIQAPAPAQSKPAELPPAKH